MRSPATFLAELVMPRVNLPALGRSLARLRVREARQGVRVRQVAVEADKCRQSSRHGPPAAQAASGALDPWTGRAAPRPATRDKF